MNVSNISSDQFVSQTANISAPQTPKSEELQESNTEKIQEANKPRMEYAENRGLSPWQGQNIDTTA